MNARYQIHTRYISSGALLAKLVAKWALSGWTEAHFNIVVSQSCQPTQIDP